MTKKKQWWWGVFTFKWSFSVLIRGALSVISLSQLDISLCSDLLIIKLSLNLLIVKLSYEVFKASVNYIFFRQIWNGSVGIGSACFFYWDE